jgi:hypothetical protein
VHVEKTLVEGALANGFGTTNLGRKKFHIQ